MLNNLRDRRGPAWFFTGQAGCYCCGTAVIGNHHVFFGTKSGGVRLATGYKWSSSAWSAITSASTGSQYRSIGYLENGVAYHAYGADATASRDSQKYESASDAWTSLTAGPTPARERAIGFMIVNFYVVGGQDFSSNTLSDNDEYSVSGDSWDAKTDLSSPARASSGGFVINAKGFVCGGINSGLANQYKDTDAYDAGSDAWTAQTDMNTEWFNNGFFAIGNKGYVAYGRIGLSGTLTRNADAYTESTNTWSTTTIAPSPVRQWVASSGVSTSSAGYVTTGQDSGGARLLDHEEFTPDTWTSSTDISGDARQQASGASC